MRLQLLGVKLEGRIETSAFQKRVKKKKVEFN